MPEPAFQETMTRVHVPHFTIRVWRDVAALRPAYDSHAELRDTLHRLPISTLPGPYAKALQKEPGVTAYEILKSDGTGTVDYLVWP